MKLITKKKTTKGYQRLLEFKQNGYGYDKVSNDLSKNDFIRDEVLISLLEEQGFICAYCLQKINLKNATIEHIIGQKYVENGVKIGEKYQVDYDNLLAVCSGKSCKEQTHCDKSRSSYQKERPLFANPLENRIMQNIKFSKTGLIYYKNFKNIEEIEKLKDHNSLDEDSNIRFDIQKVLNLNCQNLKLKREAVIKGIQKATKNWEDKTRIQKELQRCEIINGSEFVEMCQVAIYVLKSKLK